MHAPGQSLPIYVVGSTTLLRRLLNYKVPELIVTTTANSNSAKLNRAFRQPRVPTGDWDRTALWITDYHGFVSSALKHRRLPEILAYPASAAIWLRDLLSQGGRWAGRKDADLEVIFDFDDRFDLFWDELKQSYPQRLLATRSREVLQWHFKSALENRQIWIVTRREGSRLTAYGIFCRQDNTEHKLKRYRHTWGLCPNLLLLSVP